MDPVHLDGLVEFDFRPADKSSAISPSPAAFPRITRIIVVRALSIILIAGQVWTGGQARHAGPWAAAHRLRAQALLQVSGDLQKRHILLRSPFQISHLPHARIWQEWDEEANSTVRQSECATAAYCEIHASAAHVEW